MTVEWSERVLPLGALRFRAFTGNLLTCNLKRASRVKILSKACKLCTTGVDVVKVNVLKFFFKVCCCCLQCNLKQRSRCQGIYLMKFRLLSSRISWSVGEFRDCAMNFCHASACKTRTCRAIRSFEGRGSDPVSLEGERILRKVGRHSGRIQLQLGLLSLSRSLAGSFIGIPLHWWVEMVFAACT